MTVEQQEKLMEDLNTLKDVKIQRYLKLNILKNINNCTSYRRIQRK